MNNPHLLEGILMIYLTIAICMGVIFVDTVKKKHRTKISILVAYVKGLFWLPLLIVTIFLGIYGFWKDLPDDESQLKKKNHE